MAVLQKGVSKYKGNRHEQNPMNNFSFVGQYRIKEVFGNKFWEMKTFLPENKSYSLCFETGSKQTSQTSHMRSRFSALSPRLR